MIPETGIICDFKRALYEQVRVFSCSRCGHVEPLDDDLVNRIPVIGPSNVVLWCGVCNPVFDDFKLIGISLTARRRP